MEVEPPSATTRFGVFFLIGGVTLILVMLGILKHFDRPHAPAPAAAPVASPTIPPLLARPSPSVVPP